MKKIFLIFILLLFLVRVKASPVIQALSINPNQIWMENDEISGVPSISIIRSDNETNVKCYSNITAPDGTLFQLTLTEISLKNHRADQDELADYLHIFNLEGVYHVTGFCYNNTNHISNIETDQFFIYEIETFLEVSPNPSYLGEEIGIKFNLKENGIVKKNGLSNFKVSLDGQNWDFIPENPVYVISKEAYFLGIKDVGKGQHTLRVNVDYRGKTISNEVKINVEDPLQFEILNLGNNGEIKPDENLTIEVKAFDRNDGNFELDKSYLKIELGSKKVENSDFSIIKTSDNNYDILLDPPSLSPGSHSLRIDFDYKDYPLITQERRVFYTSQLTGRIINYNDDPLTSDFVFSSDYFVKSIRTYKNGSYYVYMPPDTYDLEANLPLSKLSIEGLRLREEDFSDPITYQYIENIEVDGIRTAGVFYYHIDPDFSRASVVVNYDDRYVTDEDGLSVYRCDDWDFGDKICDDNWEEISFENKKGEIEFDINGNSAYAVGNEKSIHLDFSFENDLYYLNDLVIVNGIVRDDANKPVADANVNFKIKETGFNKSVKSSSSGIVSIKFSAPSRKGNYTLLAYVEKFPYGDFTSQGILRVVEKKEISILSPETIRVEQGESSNIEFSVVNIGQSDISDLKLSISGIPENYYSFNPSINSLRVGEKEKIDVSFEIPEDATKGTFSGKFGVEYEDRSKEEIFGFTITEKTEKNNTGTNEVDDNGDNSPAPTGKFILPEISLPDLSFLYNFLYFIPIMLVSFAGSFLLKKRKKMRMSSKEDKVRNIFSEIKSEIRKKEDDN